MKTRTLIILLTAILLFHISGIMAQEKSSVIEPDKLVVLWTSDDPNVADRVALMYTHAAKTAGWFKDLTLIIWGPSAKLSSENLAIQEKLNQMKPSWYKNTKDHENDSQPSLRVRRSHS